MLPTRKILSLALLLVGGLFLNAEILSAQRIENLPAWTQTASACSPDDAAISKYALFNADFSFNSFRVSDTGKNGAPIPIVVRCNVLNPLDKGNPVWNSMYVGYQDPDGTGLKYEVFVRLKRLSRTTGGVSTIATFSSDSINNSARSEGLVTFSHNFDFVKNEYFVEIAIARTDTLANPVVYMVRLEQSF